MAMFWRCWLAVTKGTRVRAALWAGFACALWAYLPASVAHAQEVRAPASVLAAALVEPDDGLLARAYWVDPQGQATFDEARLQNYVPYRGVFNQGYNEAVHWLRLTLPASSTPLAMRITPAWLDEVTLFDPLDSGSPRTVGDLFPASANDFYGLGLSLSLSASQAPRDIWLRLKTTSAHRLDVHVMPISEIPKIQGTALMWASLYVASLLVILVMLVAAWVAQPERVLGSFLLRHFLYTFFGMAYLGLPALLVADTLSPATLDLLFSVAVIGCLPIGLAFDITLLSTYGPKRYLITALKGIAAFGVVLVLMLFLGHGRLALSLNAHVMSAAVVLVFVTAWTCKPDPSVEQLMSKRFMLAYYLLILGGVLSGLVTVLGWMQPSGWQLHILILHGLASAVVMSVMLFLRVHRQIYLGQQLSWRLSRAEQEVEQEQQRRQEQSQFLHMLTHELKTLLAVVSLALGTRGNKEKNLQLAGRAVQDMKAIIERCVQADRLGGADVEKRLESTDVVAEILFLAQNLEVLSGRLSTQLAPALHVRTDRQLLQTILGILLDNAARYGDSGYPVEVQAVAAVENDCEGVLVRVRNAPGPAGWPDTTQIFNKYYRASGAHHHSGSGLGLFLAHQLTRTLRGSLRYQPNEHQVCFELWTPNTIS